MYVRRWAEAEDRQAMISLTSFGWPARRGQPTRLLSWSVLCACLAATLVRAAPPAELPVGQTESASSAITLEAAVALGLQQNPELASLRQQHGIASAANTIRAFDNLRDRQAKLALTEEFLRLNQRGAEQVRQLVERGTLRAADLILTRAEVSDVQTQIGLNRTALVAARRDFLGAL